MAALIALAVMYFTDSNPLVIAITLVVGVMIFTTVAQHRRFRQIGVMCAITLAVLLEVGEPDEGLILWRGLDILIGAAIALLVTRFVFPIRASRQLRFHMADTIDGLGRLFTLAAADEETAEVDYEEVEDKVARGFMAQRELLPLAMIEHQVVRNNKACFQSMMRSQRAIFGLSRTIRRAYSHTSLGEQTIASLSGLANLRSRVTTHVHEIAGSIREGFVLMPDPEISAAHSAMKVAMKQATRELETQTMSPQAFTFAMEQIIVVMDLLRKDAARIVRDLANVHGSDEPIDVATTPTPQS